MASRLAVAWTPRSLALPLNLPPRSHAQRLPPRRLTHACLSLSCSRLLLVCLTHALQVSNFFADTHSFSESVFSYTYSVQAVQNAEFKAEQVLPEPGSGNQNRTIVDRHGIRLLVRVSGNVGVWDTATALVSLTSSLGLLAVAAMVVDFIATRCMPLKRVYQQYKSVQSVDFPRIQWGESRHDDVLLLQEPTLSESICVSVSKTVCLHVYLPAARLLPALLQPRRRLSILTARTWSTRRHVSCAA